jgi:hypothetical protein
VDRTVEDEDFGTEESGLPVTHEELAIIHAAAKAKGETVHVFVRRALMERLEREHILDVEIEKFRKFWRGE